MSSFLTWCMRDSGFNTLGVPKVIVLTQDCDKIEDLCLVLNFVCEG